MLVDHASEMRTATETASLHLEADALLPPTQRGHDDAVRQLDDARQTLVGLGNIALPLVSPRTFRGNWVGGEAPTMAEGAPVDISIGNAGRATIEAVEAAAAIEAILGTNTAAPSPQQQHAIAAIAQRLPAGEGQQAFLRAILAGLGKNASVLPRDAEYGADDAIIEGLGNAVLGPVGGSAADTWYRQSGAKQLAGDIVLSIQVSERFAPAVFRREWDQVKEHWPTIVATALGFIGAEVLAAVFLASGNAALEVAGAALEFALLAYFIYCTAEEICHAAEAIAAWLSACVAAHGQRDKIGDASHKFCVVMREMMKLILAAALGGAMKGLRSLTRGGRVVESSAGLDGAGDIPSARTVRDDMPQGLGKHTPAGDSPRPGATPEVGEPRRSPDVVASTPTSPTPAGATRLPQDGTWIGEPGNSVFIPNRASKLPHPDDPRVVDLQRGEGIPFKNGQPDFSRWAVDEFDVPSLTGNRNTPGVPRDSQLMELAVAERYGLLGPRGKPTATAGRAYLRRLGLVAHHAGGTKVQLVPQGIHGQTRVRIGVPHSGGASDLRSGND